MEGWHGCGVGGREWPAAFVGTVSYQHTVTTHRKLSQSLLYAGDATAQLQGYIQERVIGVTAVATGRAAVAERVEQAKIGEEREAKRGRNTRRATGEESETA